MDEVEDVRAATPLGRLRTWLGPPRSYVLTRWLILRLRGVSRRYMVLPQLVSSSSLRRSS